MKYAYIEQSRDRYSIGNMCQWLGVSRSGYYKWRSRVPSQQSIRWQRTCEIVRETFYRFKKRYGAPRLVVELNENGIPCSRNYIAKAMSASGLKARNGKQFRYEPCSLSRSHVADNLLKRDFSATAPNEKWVSDITYIQLEKGYAYLAVIMDLFSRQIIGWSLDRTMTTDLVLNAFEMAVNRRKVSPGLLLHSDRGVQYRSSVYQYALSKHQVRPSMSRKGNCWDNAAMESFFFRLKVECVYAEEINTKDEAYAQVFDYIELFYNTIRRHSAIGYLSPKDYESKYFEKAA